MNAFRPLLLLASLSLLLSACFDNTRPTPPTVVTPVRTPAPVPVRIGIALGGGAAKGFAHIGVIKMLEANGLRLEVVSGTSAGSVVGALYASGMDAFAMQRQAFALDESRIRDVSLLSGGVVKGQKLQDYVNQLVGNRTLERMRKPLAVVSTQLETGERTVFTRGNTGQAVRASSSIPGVFEPVLIGKFHYVDGGVVSPVPVDAARGLGADFVIAVDISSKASGRNPGSLLGTVGQSITIMGQRLGQQELARADVVIRPSVNDIGATDFDQRNNAILEGERAALAALPQIRARLVQLQRSRAGSAPAGAGTAGRQLRTRPARSGQAVRTRRGLRQAGDAQALVVARAVGRGLVDVVLRRPARQVPHRRRPDRAAAATETVARERDCYRRRDADAKRNKKPAVRRVFVGTSNK